MQNWAVVFNDGILPVTQNRQPVTENSEPITENSHAWQNAAIAYCVLPYSGCEFFLSVASLVLIALQFISYLLPRYFLSNCFYIIENKTDIYVPTQCSM